MVVVTVLPEPVSAIVDTVEGHWKVLPDKSMSLMSVSIGVFPTNRTKNSCSITRDDTEIKMQSNYNEHSFFC